MLNVQKRRILVCYFSFGRKLTRPHTQSTLSNKANISSESIPEHSWISRCWIGIATSTTSTRFLFVRNNCVRLEVNIFAVWSGNTAAKEMTLHTLALCERDQDKIILKVQKRKSKPWDVNIGSWCFMKAMRNELNKHWALAELNYTWERAGVITYQVEMNWDCFK